MDIRSKKIGILGANRSGIGAAGLAIRQGGIPFVSDISPAEKIAGELQILQDLGVPYECGVHSDKVLESDFVVISPGIPLDAPVVKSLRESGISIYSEIEFASWFCAGTVVAVSGTNGKTTTTSLMHHVVEVSGKKSYAAGNIGSAFSAISDKVESDAVVSLEVSSFQLDTTAAFKPAVAMLLNITPDHLDRYENNFEKYIQSKYLITKNQRKNDLLILNNDDPVFTKYAVSTSATMKFFSANNTIGDGVTITDESLEYREADAMVYSIKKSQLLLLGEHNHKNAAAVIIAAKYCGISNDALDEGLSTFKSVEHRLEFAGKINGISFINDSKATNVDSVIVAVKSFPTPVYLILGGKDKGNDYSLLLPYMQNVKKIYAIGSSKDKILSFFDGKISVEAQDSLQSCVEKVLSEGKEGDTLLLSPACASFDMFRNFEDRGRVFKEAVIEVMNHD